jgi:C4-dicarboxylate-specific signal transduction histidine kinase
MFTRDGRYIQLVRVGIESGLAKNIEKIAWRVIPGISFLGYKIPLYEESIYKKMRDTGRPIVTENIVIQDKDSVIRTTVERIALDYTSPGSPLRLLIKTLIVPMLPYKSVIDMPIVAGNKVAGAIALTSDTDLTEAEYKLKKTNAQLLQSAKLASIGELATGVAHELNQPLTVIKGFAQSLQRKVTQGILDKESLVEILPVVERNAMRMGEIIDHLRTFSRLPHTKMEPVNINQVIENALLLMGRQLDLYGITVIKAHSSQSLFCHGHAGQLEQVVLNLLSNAKDALMEQEISMKGLEISKDYKKTLTIKTETGGNGHIILSVTDNGMGIAQENLDKVFDPFFTTKEVGKGTGLGLSVSYNIVKEHKGEIEIVSSQGEGAKVKVMLPAC